MAEQQVDKKGCFGGLLMALGVIGCIIGLFYGDPDGWILGPLIPIGYLIQSS